MSVSESEKVGVTILDSQFSGKAEHVPIKKRRFMFRSPSPTPPPPTRRSRSPITQENESLIKKCDLSLGSHPEVEVVVSASDPHISVDADVGVDVTKLEKVNAHVDANETVVRMDVCGTSLGQDDGFSEVDSGVHDSTALESSHVLSSNKVCDFLNGLSKEDVSSANVSSEVTGSCITKVPTKDFVASSRVDMPSLNSPSQGIMMEATSLHDQSEELVQELSKEEETIGTHKHSSRDDRLHWDLNTPIDAWECQFDNHVVADAVAKKSEDSKLIVKIVDKEENCLLREPAVHEADTKNTLLQNDLVSVGGIQLAHELQVDYDSQYEDGELRESIENTWEEFDVEDGEAEHVDYGSEDRDTCSFDAYNPRISMSEGARRKNRRFADTNSLCYEQDLSLSIVQECNSRSGPKTFPVLQVIEAARSSNVRAVKTCQPFVKPYASGKDPIDKSDGSDQVDKELGVSPDKLIQMNENHNREDAVMDLNQSVDFSTEQICQDPLPESCKSNVDIESEVEGCSDIITTDDNEAKLLGSRGIKMELQSRGDGPPNHGTFLRKNRPQGSRFNYVDYSESRPVREWNTATSFRTGRDSQQFHYRGWRGDYRVDSPEGHRGFKRQFSPSYPGPRKFYRPETESHASVISGKVDKDRFTLNGTIERSVGEGPSNRSWRHITDSSSHDASRSPRDTNSNRDRGMHLGTRSTEKFNGGSASVGRGRGRYIRRYDQGFEDRRPSGGRCHRPVSDDWSVFPSSYSHNLTGRERSFSPIERRKGFHANHPSRSRTRSPNNWQSPRRRNIATNLTDRPSFEYRNRSPDFRSRGGMPRMRPPHQREGFSTNREIDYTVMPRRQGSPQRNTRWVDNQEGGNNFRDRRSSPKNFSAESFGFVESQQRPNKNNYSRTSHPETYSKSEYEGNYIDRRHGYRQGQVHHSIRRHDSDGALNEFRHDKEDDFVPDDNNCNKAASDFSDRRTPKDYSEGLDSQNLGAARRSREERGSFSYRQDANFSANSKSFEVRDIE